MDNLDCSVAEMNIFQLHIIAATVLCFYRLGQLLCF